VENQLRCKPALAISGVGPIADESPTAQVLRVNRRRLELGQRGDTPQRRTVPEEYESGSDPYQSRQPRRM